MKPIECMIPTIEKKTDYDVLNYNEFAIDVINRLGDDGKIVTIGIYGKTENEIINDLKCLR